MTVPLAGWVAPFGDPGINDRSHLPRAFRSVPRPSSPLSAKASTRCPSHASRATPNGKHRETRRCDKQRRWSNDAPGLTRGPPSSLAAFAWANAGRLGEAALHRMQQSSPFRRHFVTEPAGQRDPMRVSPAAASVAVTTRFFTSVHQQHPARPRGREGQFLSSAAMSRVLPPAFAGAFRDAPVAGMPGPFGVCQANACRPAAKAALSPGVEAFGETAFRRSPTSLAARLVEVNGLEPSTSGLQSRRSPS